MKLARWLSLTGTSEAAFAARIGVSAISVRRYRDGLRLPMRDVMVRIVAATDGEVGPEDFYRPHHDEARPVPEGAR